MDAPIAQAYIRLIDPSMIDDQSIGDDRIDSSLRAGCLRLAHTVADHFAATELHLFAVEQGIVTRAFAARSTCALSCQVALDLNY